MQSFLPNCTQIENKYKIYFLIFFQLPSLFYQNKILTKRKFLTNNSHKIMSVKRSFLPLLVERSACTYSPWSSIMMNIAYWKFFSESP